MHAMKKNLETADHVTKLILALAAVVFYVTGIIEGPVAKVLMVLGALVLILFFAKVVLN